MDRYVKSVIITLILAVSVWEIMCIAPQGTTIIHNKPDSSSLLIQQESGQNIPHSNPATPAPNRGGSRDYVNPNRPQQNTQIVPGRQSLPQTPVPNMGESRDYVNPNSQNVPGGQNLPQTGPATSAANRGTPQQNTGGPQTSVNNRGGGRDYVNPNAQALPQSGTNRGAVRGYANPTISQTIPQNGQQFRPSPRNANLGSRDYVNPNFNSQTSQPSYANIAGGPQTSSNNFQGANFPALPTRNGPQLPAVQSTTPLSYASKVSGGATTKSPTGQQNPSVSGPSSSTTQKPEEGPSDIELRDFSEALLRRDVNNAAKFLTVNVQGKTTSQSKNDQAPEKLLIVQEDGYKISTISKLKLLHNNYILSTNENEYVTPQEKQEENDLLEAMLTTPVMQYTRNFLVSRGKIGQDPKVFKDLLKLLWFNMYSRGGGRIGSSGFEHIFLAELKNNEVSGLHNWVYFDQAEMSKIADYLGYMKKIDLGEKGAILKFHFKLNGVDKPVGSMFIGTSPELEMALYTTCYMFRADRICPLRLNGNNFIIRTYNYRYRGKNLIGSAFPEI